MLTLLLVGFLENVNWWVGLGGGGLIIKINLTIDFDFWLRLMGQTPLDSSQRELLDSPKKFEKSKNVDSEDKYLQKKCVFT